MPCHVPSGCCSLAIYFGMHAAPDCRPGAWLAGSRRLLLAQLRPGRELESLAGRRDGDEQERVGKGTYLPGRAAFVFVARARPRQAWRGALTRGLAGKRDEGLGWAGSCFWQWRSVGVGVGVGVLLHRTSCLPSPAPSAQANPRNTHFVVRRLLSTQGTTTPPWPQKKPYEMKFLSLNLPLHPNSLLPPFLASPSRRLCIMTTAVF